MNKQKIRWNEVTWYSKFLALVIFAGLPFLGFWFGRGYGQMEAMVQDKVSCAISDSVWLPGVAATPALHDYYRDIATWQKDQRNDAGFSMAHPLDFNVEDNYAMTPVTDWRMDAGNAPGQKRLTLTIPATFEPQTNFADAKLTVGTSDGDGAKHCLDGQQATTTLAEVPFSIFKSAGAGAGNYYETTSYRTVHAGLCYAIEYTIHSTQIANYPEQYQLKSFDRNTITDVLDRVVRTFKFL